MDSDSYCSCSQAHIKNGAIDDASAMHYIPDTDHGCDSSGTPMIIDAVFVQFE